MKFYYTARHEKYFFKAHEEMYQILTRYVRLNCHVTLHLVSLCQIWKIVGIPITGPSFMKKY